MPLLCALGTRPVASSVWHRSTSHRKPLLSFCCRYTPGPTGKARGWSQATSMPTWQHRVTTGRPTWSRLSNTGPSGPERD
eukprot:12462379-Alexandrium_andersonii.AAC.1